MPKKKARRPAQRRSVPRPGLATRPGEGALDGGGLSGALSAAVASASAPATSAARTNPRTAEPSRSGAAVGVAPSGSTATAVLDDLDERDDDAAVGSPLAVTSVPWAALADRDPQALGMTYTFDTDADGEPYGVSVRLRGRRIDVAGVLGPQDQFDVVRELVGVLPGSGPIALTHRVLDLAPGEWRVTAQATRLPRTQGSARQAPLPRGSATGRTGYAPMVRVKAPGVVLGAWPALVATGVILGLLVQYLLARHLQLPAGRTTLITLAASVVGLVGSKVYFLLLHPDRQAPGMLMVGMAVQGFVLGAIGTGVLGAALAGIPVGPFLDVTAAGLLVGMTSGRFGCFFGGCCAGRPTGSRLGLRSSDRGMRLRRIPTQLLESALAATLATISAVLVWFVRPSPSGLLFVAAIAAYTLGRQLLFPLRDLGRTTTRGRVIVMGLSGVVLVLAVLVIVVVS